MQRYFVVSLCLSWLAVTGIALAHTISAQALGQGRFSVEPGGHTTRSSRG